MRYWVELPGDKPLGPGPSTRAAVADSVAELLAVYGSLLRSTHPEPFETFWGMIEEELMTYSTPIRRRVLYSNLWIDKPHKFRDAILRPIEGDDFPMSQFLASPDRGSVLEFEFRGRRDHRPIPMTRRSEQMGLEYAVATLFKLVPIIARQQDTYLGYRDNGSSAGTGALYVPSGPAITLDDEKLAQIEPASEKIVKIFDGSEERERRLQRAIQAHSGALEAKDRAQAIIYAWIGLEALFGDNRDVAYRVAFRIACFNHDDSNERKNWIEKAEQSYATRSLLVHGGAVKEGALDSDGAMSMLSRALLRVLEKEQRYPSHPLEIDYSLL